VPGQSACQVPEQREMAHIVLNVGRGSKASIHCATEFTALAMQGCTGFTPANSTLTDVRVTNNGRAGGVLQPRSTDMQGGAVYFKQGSSGWTFDTCGTDFVGSGIPSDVTTTLFPSS
jgi:hypothetical protein